MTVNTSETPTPIRPTAKVRPILLFTTVPDRATADSLARRLVEERLAACVHRLPSGRSTYRWQGEVEDVEEQTLLIKSDRALLDAIEAHLRQHHPYDLPELIGHDISAASAPYLDWLQNSLRR
jgi:periplasmic divalent cation tolerance protein